MIRHKLNSKDNQSKRKNLLKKLLKGVNNLLTRSVYAAPYGFEKQFSAFKSDCDQNFVEEIEQNVSRESKGKKESKSKQN